MRSAFLLFLTALPLHATEPISFRHDVLPTLSRLGCNQGACHGTPTGKGGFKLSLRGFDPPYDYRVLTREYDGRRINIADPDASLLLRKGMGRMPHQGAARFSANSREFAILHGWITAGAKDDGADLAELTALTIEPSVRQVRVGTALPMKVIARYADGRSQDVTDRTTFTSSDESVAEVSTAGIVHGKHWGDVAILGRYQQLLAPTRVTFTDTEPLPVTREIHPIDQALSKKLALFGVSRSAPATDSVFVRRLYLDVLGRLPDEAETRAYLADVRPDRRERLIDSVLDRPEFADFWAMKWADILRLNEHFIDRAGVVAFHKWIHNAVAEDRPLDRFVHDIIAANGSTITSPQANFYRTMETPEEIGESVSQLFLGVRMGCARCHNHPFERWTQDEFFGLAAVFAQVECDNKMAIRPALRERKRPDTLKRNLEAVVTHPRTDRPVPPSLPAGERWNLAPQADPRLAFADWLTAPENPYFARTMANRIWFHVLGRGIVEPVDDFRESNPPADAALLELLTQQLRAGGMRLKPLVRFIVTSKTYQADAKSHNPDRAAPHYFARAQVKALGAEVLLDAVSRATGVAEPFAQFPEADRAVQIAGAIEENRFLKAFNRPARRLPCECERDPDSTLTQALQLIAGRKIESKLRSEEGIIARWILEKRSDPAIIESLYLRTLTRFPQVAERTAILAALAEGSSRREVFEDVLWALLNSKEFLYRH